ncbi:MAG: methylenetetrahydrofolate reductase [Desulfobacteraceae bacterium]|nr:methylenetetrahydrofolate reductase [Desulfobacteraceae bacterium]
MNMKKKLSAAEFVVLAEMNTPKGVDISEFVTNARGIKGRMDAVVIPDMDNGVMRMSALGGGALMRREGLEPVIHIYGRDKNRMALQGDILAAYVLGIQNLIVTPAEPMASGDHRDAKPVEDLDETGILEMIRSLCEGVDLAGFELKGAPDFTVGCAMAPVAGDQELAREVENLRGRVAAGAQYIITPPVFDLAAYEKMIEALRPLEVPLVATVFLLKNVGMARYLSIHEPGCRISEDMIRRIRKAPDREAECIRMAGETTAELRKMVRGVKITTLGWEHRLADILEKAGI